MLLMCFFFWSKKLSCILMVFLNELFIFFPDHLHWQLWTVTLYGICTAVQCYLVLLWDIWDITRRRSRYPAKLNREHFPTLVSSFWILTFVTSSILVVGGFLDYCDSMVRLFWLSCLFHYLKIIDFCLKIKLTTFGSFSIWRIIALDS